MVFRTRRRFDYEQTRSLAREIENISKDVIDISENQRIKTFARNAYKAAKGIKATAKMLKNREELLEKKQEIRRFLRHRRKELCSLLFHLKQKPQTNQMISQWQLKVV